MQIADGGFDIHESLDMMKREDNAEFKAVYQEMSRKYRLPEIAESESEASGIQPTVAQG